jgi:hypothetical protein
MIKNVVVGYRLGSVPPCWNIEGNVFVAGKDSLYCDVSSSTYVAS